MLWYSSTWLACCRSVRLQAIKMMPYTVHAQPLAHAACSATLWCPCSLPLVLVIFAVGQSGCRCGLYKPVLAASDTCVLSLTLDWLMVVCSKTLTCKPWCGQCSTRTPVCSTLLPLCWLASSPMIHPHITLLLRSVCAQHARTSCAPSSACLHLHVTFHAKQSSMQHMPLLLALLIAASAGRVAAYSHALMTVNIHLHMYNNYVSYNITSGVYSVQFCIQHVKQAFVCQIGQALANGMKCGVYGRQAWFQPWQSW